MYVRNVRTYNTRIHGTNIVTGLGYTYIYHTCIYMQHCIFSDSLRQKQNKNVKKNTILYFYNRKM